MEPEASKPVSLSFPYQNQEKINGNGAWGLQGSFLYISLLKSMEHALKWSMKSPGSIPLYLLVKINGRSIQIEPGTSRVDCLSFPHYNQ